MVKGIDEIQLKRGGANGDIAEEDFLEAMKDKAMKDESIESKVVAALLQVRNVLINISKDINSSNIAKVRAQNINQKEFAKSITTSMEAMSEMFLELERLLTKPPPLIEYELAFRRDNFNNILSPIKLIPVRRHQ